MRTLVIFAFLLVLALAVSARSAHNDNLPVVYGYKQGTPCPAKYFKDVCNRCSCSDDGMHAACTRMFCPGGMIRRA